jgi:hypothetical protein
MKKILLPLACLAALALGGLEFPAHASSSSSSSVSDSSCARKHGKRKHRSSKKKSSAQTPVQL